MSEGPTQPVCQVNPSAKPTNNPGPTTDPECSLYPQRL